MKQLKYPPPANCEKCNKQDDVFATIIGWVCWDCMPDDFLVDEDGIKYEKPEITKKDRRDIKEIRDALSHREKRITEEQKVRPKVCRDCGGPIVKTGRGRPPVFCADCNPKNKSKLSTTL